MENLDIAKFGGTSVGNFEAMSSSYKVVIGNKKSRVVVVSACAGVTNLLVELASELKRLLLNFAISMKILFPIWTIKRNLGSS